jgi:acyl-coenzyme A thioesterase PaaI-like protein
MGMLVKDWSAGGPVIYSLWQKLGGTSLGRKLFTKIIGKVAPYSGTMPAVVNKLEPGKSEIVLKNCRAVQNHLGSVHAMALTNLAELASGLAMMVCLTDKSRGILAGFEIEFIKKARTNITAKVDWQVEVGSESKKYHVPVDLYNSDNEIVAKANAIWLIGPKKEKNS